MEMHEIICKSLLTYLQLQIGLLRAENYKQRRDFRNSYSKYVDSMSKKVRLEYEIEELMTKKESLPTLEEDLKQQKRQYIRGSEGVFVLLSLITLVLSITGNELGSIKSLLAFNIQVIGSLGAFMAMAGTSCYFLNTRQLRSRIKEINLDSLRQKIASKAIDRKTAMDDIKLYRIQAASQLQQIKDNKAKIADYKGRKNYLEENMNNGSMKDIVDQITHALPSSSIEPLKDSTLQSKFPVTEFMSTPTESEYVLKKSRKTIKKERNFIEL